MKEEKKKQGKGKSIGLKISLTFILIAVIAGLVSGLVYTVAFSKKTVDLTKYFEISYEGYDGYASADGEINEEELEKFLKNSKVTEKFIKKLDYELDKDSNLSNGDTIKVKFSISNSFLEENRLKIKEKTIKFTVEGLEGSKELDLSKYVELECTGFNKQGSAVASLSSDLKDEIGKNNFEEMQEKISFSIQNNGELENGEDAKISITISDSWLKENGIDLKSKTFNVKVEGLEESKEIDGFSGLSVDVTGMSPNLSLAVSNTSSDDFIKTIKYAASKTSGISNGETVKITISEYDEEMAEENGYIFEKQIFDYKVDSQAAYIYNVSEITPEIREQIKSSYIEKAKSEATMIYSYGKHEEYAKKKIRDVLDYKYVELGDKVVNQDLTMGNPEVVAVYLLTKKDQSANGDINKVIGIMKFPYTSSTNGVTYNWYVTVTGKNFSTKTDGTISDNTVYSASVEYGKDEAEAYDHWINLEKTNYNVESIPLK